MTAATEGSSTSRAARRLAAIRDALGEGALRLACHAAVPVVVNAELLNLLRVNFFLDDPPNVLPFEVEAELLLSPLFREIGEGLYEIEPELRNVMLSDLRTRYGWERVSRVAVLLKQYTDASGAWRSLPELEMAQQLTAMSFLDPGGAQRWLDENEAGSTEPSSTASALGSGWYIAMRRRIADQPVVAGSEWDAVIDVSNVCWDDQLPPGGRRRPVWGRLEMVMAAWRRAHGSGARFGLVADDSLMHSLDDAREYGRLLAAGQLMVAPAADVEILKLAQKRSWHVISRDHFVDYRREHPWIEAAPDRFHSWRTERGTVRIVPAGITARSAQEVSRAVEFKELRQHRLDPRNPRYNAILGSRWQCRNKECPESAHWQGHLLALPMVTSDGEPRCPTCAGPLADRGPRERLYEIVVEDLASGEEIMRFPLELNSPVIVGRGTSLKGVNLQVYSASAFRSAVERVSRRHLMLRVEEPRTGTQLRMAVTDLGSSNGTRVRRAAGTGFSKPKALAANIETFLMEGDQLVLGDAITLRLSGRRYLAKRADVPSFSVPSGGTQVFRQSSS